jgi:hypothetical protein
MVANGESGIVRAGKQEAERLGLNIGDKIFMGDGRKFIVQEAYKEDIKLFGDAALFVSEKDLTGVPDVINFPQDNFNPIKIGCDPEFALTNMQGGFIDASTKFRKDTPLGSDADLGELRPRPSYNPEYVVEDIRRLILLMKHRRDFTPIGSSHFCGRHIGFHLHFQIPKSVVLFAIENSINIISSIVHVLDCFIGVPAMLFDESDVRRLSTSQYGKPGDFRVSDNTLEYRTVGGVYLRDYLFTKRLLYTASIVMGNVMEFLDRNSKMLTSTSAIKDNSYFCKAYGLPKPKDVKYILSSINREPIRELLAEVRNGFFSNIVIPDKFYSLVTDFLYLTKEDVGESLIDNWI